MKKKIKGLKSSFILNPKSFEMLNKTIHLFAHPKTSQYLWIYILTIFSLTLGYCFLYKTQTDDLIEQLSFLAQKTPKAIEKKKSYQEFIEKHKSQEENSLQHECNKLQLLSKEKDFLIPFLNNPLCLSKDKIQNRLNFLQSEQNKVAFISTDFQKNSKQQQTSLKLASKVYADKDDLKKILSLIEQETIDEFTNSHWGPQIIISYFHLTPQISSIQTENFELYLELIQREFTP